MTTKAIPVTITGTQTDNADGTITIEGTATFEVEVPPFDPNVPHPEHPIMLPGMPGWGTGPWTPRPTHPIALPGDPWWGTFPPQPFPPPAGGPPMGGQLPASDPEGSGWVFGYVPGYGWMWSWVPQPPEAPPEGEAAPKRKK